MITVVNISGGHSGRMTKYCGRCWAGYAQSIFHNPFHIGKDGNREEVLRKFIIYWFAPEQSVLRGKAVMGFSGNEILGCWCKPFLCHCDVIAGYVNWVRRGALDPGLFS